MGYVEKFRRKHVGNFISLMRGNPEQQNGHFASYVMYIYSLFVLIITCVQICRSRRSGTAVDRSTERNENIRQTIIKNGKGT